MKGRELIRWLMLIAVGGLLYLLGDYGLHQRTLPLFLLVLFVITIVAVLIFPKADEPPKPRD